MKTDKKTIGVDAVNKALEILNCFTEKNEALTITKIANITGDHKSRISRISKSLENFGYIRKIKSGEFKIGHTIPRLFEIYESSFNLKNSIKAELDFISSKTKETASFFVKQNDVRVCIQSSSPNKSIRHQEVIGGKKPLNNSHCVIDNPESVNLVKPPITIIRNTMAVKATNHSIMDFL